MNWYIVIGIVLLALVILLYLYNKKMKVSHLFSTMYLAWYDKTGSVETSLRKGVENFTYRFPFNQLSDNDIASIVKVAINSENPPKSLARLMQYADENNSVNVLYEYVEQMNKYIVR